MSQRIVRVRVCAVAMVAAAALAAPASADKAPSGSAPIAELMTPNALPDIVEGAADAPVTIIEYAALNDGRSGAFHRDVYPMLREHYIDKGQVRFILREFPDDALATAAFMVVRAMGDKRGAAIDLLFAEQKSWVNVDLPLESLAHVLAKLGVDKASFDGAIKDHELYQKVVGVRARAAQKLGVNSSPTFFVNGERYRGDINAADLEKIVLAKTPAKH